MYVFVYLHASGVGVIPGSRAVTRNTDSKAGLGKRRERERREMVARMMNGLTVLFVNTWPDCRLKFRMTAISLYGR
jgi:hypothetical protein